MCRCVDWFFIGKQHRYGKYQINDHYGDCILQIFCFCFVLFRFAKFSKRFIGKYFCLPIECACYLVQIHSAIYAKYSVCICMKSMRRFSLEVIHFPAIDKLLPFILSVSECSDGSDYLQIGHFKRN